MFSLTDTHCHLDFQAFEADRRAVLDRALDAGVDRILNPGIDLETSRRAVDLANGNAEVFAAIGVHPNEALSWGADTRDQLRELAKSNKVVAIGEIGLDYYRERAPHDLQRAVFSQQLELAEEFRLPVVIHTRDASKDMPEATRDALDLLSEWQRKLNDNADGLASRPGVLHSFAGGVAFAKEAVKIKFLIGLTGPVTFPKAVDTQALVAEIGVENILVETDAPFLTPVPFRGQRNEPGFVRFVAKKISEILNLSYEDVLKITSSNADRLFEWRASY